MKLVFFAYILILPLQILKADSDELSSLKDKVLQNSKDEKIMNEEPNKVLDDLNKAVVLNYKECQAKSKKNLKECVAEIQNFRRKVYLKVIQNKSDYLDDKDIEFEEAGEIEKILNTTISP